MRKLYSERRDFFIEQFNKYLGQHFRMQIPEAGLHFVAWLRRKEDFALFTQARTETGVTPTKLSFYRGGIGSGFSLRFCGLVAGPNSRRTREAGLGL
jgi:DNA-binding transcriptional MocR family regulator